MQPPTPRFHEWLAAEKQAQAAERRLHAAMRESAAGSDAGGLPDLLLAAQAARAKAACLLDGALLELKTLADEHERARGRRACEFSRDRRASGPRMSSPVEHNAPWIPWMRRWVMPWICLASTARPPG